MIRVMLASVISLMIVTILVSCEQSNADAARNSTTPPRGAKLVDPEIPTEDIAGAIFRYRNDSERAAFMNEWKDMWIQPPGWFGTIEKVQDDGDHQSVWLNFPASPVYGGSFWVGLDVPTYNAALQPAHQISYTGRIEKIEMLNPGVRELRFIIRNVKILTIDGVEVK